MERQPKKVVFFRFYLGKESFLYEILFLISFGTIFDRYNISNLIIEYMKVLKIFYIVRRDKNGIDVISSTSDDRQSAKDMVYRMLRKYPKKYVIKKIHRQYYITNTETNEWEILGMVTTLSKAHPYALISNTLSQNLTEYDDLFSAQYGIMEFMRLRNEEIDKQTKTYTIAQNKDDKEKKTYYKILRCVREIES